MQNHPDLYLYPSGSQIVETSHRLVEGAWNLRDVIVYIHNIGMKRHAEPQSFKPDNSNRVGVTRVSEASSVSERRNRRRRQIRLEGGKEPQKAVCKQCWLPSGDAQALRWVIFQQFNNPEAYVEHPIRFSLWGFATHEAIIVAAPCYKQRVVRGTFAVKGTDTPIKAVHKHQIPFSQMRQIFEEDK